MSTRSGSPNRQQEEGEIPVTKARSLAQQRLARRHAEAEAEVETKPQEEEGEKQPVRRAANLRFKPSSSSAATAAAGGSSRGRKSDLSDEDGGEEERKTVTYREKNSTRLEADGEYRWFSMVTDGLNDRSNDLVVALWYAAKVCQKMGHAPPLYHETMQNLCNSIYLGRKGFQSEAGAELGFKQLYKNSVDIIKMLNRLVGSIDRKSMILNFYEKKKGETLERDIKDVVEDIITHKDAVKQANSEFFRASDIFNKMLRTVLENADELRDQAVDETATGLSDEKKQKAMIAVAKPRFDAKIKLLEFWQEKSFIPVTVASMVLGLNSDLIRMKNRIGKGSIKNGMKFYIQLEIGQPVVQKIVENMSKENKLPEAIRKFVNDSINEERGYVAFIIGHRAKFLAKLAEENGIFDFNDKNAEEKKKIPEDAAANSALLIATNILFNSLK